MVFRRHPGAVLHGGLLARQAAVERAAIAGAMRADELAGRGGRHELAVAPRILLR